MEATLLPPKAEDIEPAAKLRKYLQRARAHGRPFEDAWQFGVWAALSGLPRGGRTSSHATWNEIFASTRHVWKAAYERAEDVEWLDAMKRLHDEL